MRLSPLRLLLATLLVGLFSQVAWALTEDRGRSPSGAYFVIQIPDGWQPGNGLVLINHGFDLREPSGTPSLGPQVLKQRQLDQGYAVAASSYSDNGWALFSTERDHAELLAHFRQRFGEPGPIIASGGSLGGLVSLQQAAQTELGEVVGVYALCTPAAGSRVWDHAFDLRLIYDQVCDNVSGGELPRGGQGLPYALDESDLDDFDSWLNGGRIYAAINKCTGIDLPSWAVSSGMERRLDKILEVSGVTRDFFLTNMAYATFGVSDLLRSGDKLGGLAALDNRFVDYGDATVNQQIRRVQADPLAALRLRLHYSPRGSLGGAKVLSTHTSGDGLVSPSHQQALQALLPAQQLSTAFVRETRASHCDYSDAEIVAGWDELQQWLEGGPKPTVGSLNAHCQALAASGQASGQCRYDASVNPPPLSAHLRPRNLPSFPVQARSSGLWFNPQTPGQGYVVEALDEQRAVVAWFSFPAAGESGDQAWFFGTGEIVDDAIVVKQMQRPTGARFGAAFRPGDVRLEAWGEQHLMFPSCGAGQTSWDAVAPYAEGRQDLAQLSQIGALSCAVSAAPSTAAAHWSGAWFAPARAGEGAFVHVQDDGRVFMLWFSYRPQGGQAWIYGEGVVDGQGVRFDRLLRPVGTRFGSDFDPAQVRFERWGQGRIDFPGCDQGRLSYQADDPSWGSGSLDWVRLTRPQQVADCRAPAVQK